MSKNKNLKPLFHISEVRRTTLFDGSMSCPPEYELNSLLYQKLYQKPVRNKYLLLSEDGEVSQEFDLISEIETALKIPYRTLFNHVKKERVFKHKKKRFVILARGIYESTAAG